jgi:tRNA modification GTPase
VSAATHENIATLLTPPGKAAIAVIGVSGPRAWDIVAPLLRSRGDLPVPERPAAGSMLFGRFGVSASASDEVVVHVRAIGERPLIEVHCHGGVGVTRMIEAALVARGAALVSSGAWLRRHEDADRAEAMEVLQRCPTARTASIALDYVQGAFRRVIDEVDERLKAGDRDAARNRLERLSALIPIGEHLDRPWRVVLAGAPNVGKSSLVNALAGFARSLVSPIAGTTRDVVTTRIALDGWPVELSDTAGLRGAEDAIELAGVERAQRALAGADCVVWVMDATAPPVPPPDGLRCLAVVNKVDLATTWDIGPAGMAVSARTGAGLEALTHAISARLVPSPPHSGEPVPITESARAAVRALRRQFPTDDLDATH